MANGNGKGLLAALLTIAVAVIIALGGVLYGQETVSDDLSCFKDDTVRTINEQSQRITSPGSGHILEYDYFSNLWKNIAP